ncbi:MAG TPA: hypothetical protein VGD37_33005 [Kofleriaceae bacterium]
MTNSMITVFNNSHPARQPMQSWRRAGAGASLGRAALGLLAFAPLLAACALDPEAREVEDPSADSSGDLAPPSDKPTVQTGVAQSALSSWVLTLNASQTSLWPTQPLTLTMTANQDVGPTPLYMTIWDSRPGINAVRVARCATGTVCSVTLTSSVPAFVTYIAELTDVSDNESVENSLIAQIVNVEWKSANLTMSVSPTTLPVGATTTLTAHTVEIGSSPSYTEIFDVTTGTRLAVCGSGTVCSASISQAVATTHAFRAYFSQLSTASPPPGIVEQTPMSYATWTASGYSLGLGASFDQVTATSSVDVGPTPYYIEIFDLTLGTRIALCGSGTTCSASVSVPAWSSHAVVAFISANDPTLTPASIQAVSSTVLATGKPPG